MSTPPDQPDQQPDQQSDQQPDQPPSLSLERFALATAMRKAAERLLGPDHGVTIFVHGNTAQDPHVAMQTTLPNRVAVRHLIADVLFQSLIADGATVDNAIDFLRQELANEWVRS